MLRADDRRSHFGSKASRPNRTRRRGRLSVEALEPRTLLAAIRIGTLGDSVTDEYQFYAPDRTAARNWVEQLATLRPAGADFGAFSTTSRGEIRNQGYAQNWARNGAVASTPTSPPNPYDPEYTFPNEYNGGFPDASNIGLITQPGGLSNVDVVTILIGGNDFKNEILVTLGNPSPATLLGNLAKAQARVIAGVTDAVAAIRAASPTIPIIIASTPDPGKTALFGNLFRSALTPQEAELALGVISGFVHEADQSLQALATQNNAQFIDVNDLLAQFAANPVIDGVFIDVLNGGPEYTNFFVGDGFHPGTIGQAILANAIIEKLNTLFPSQPIAPLSNSEILAFAAATQPASQVAYSSSTSTAPPGQPVTFTFQVSTFPSFESATNEGTFPSPTGTVQFFDASNNNALLGLATLNSSGVATLTTSALPAGIHQVTATYSGDSVYPPALTPSSTVIVGNRKQIRLLTLIQQFQTNVALDVTPPRFNRWTRLLERGFRPKVLARAIVQRALRAQPVAQTRIR
jgi:lysophospholipase L1-like esterase